MKKRTFFIGLASGLILSQTWRPITKKGIKFGMLAGLKLREFSQQAMEDIGDLTAEAAEELQAEAVEAAFKRGQKVTVEQDQKVN